MKYVVTAGAREIVVEVAARDGGAYGLLVDGEPASADFHPAGGASLFSLLLDGESFDVAVVPEEQGVRVTLRARAIDLAVESEQERNARLVGGPGQAARRQVIKSPMPGFVSRVLVKEGDQVEGGQPLLILEAMKMENEIRSLASGTVAALKTAEGDTVNGGQELVLIS